tara:strand:- start:44 stop:442 length:399 start_codon:yes stop_codon:yes gene_type:complete
MTLAVTTDILVDGIKTAVVKFTGRVHTSTTGAEAAVVKVDASALSPVPTNIKIQRLWYTSTVLGTYLEFAGGTTNGIAVAIPDSSSGYLDFRAFGGIKDNSTGTASNDITLTTGITLAVGMSYSIIVEVSKT